MSKGIQPGTTATSAESHISEVLHNQWVRDIINEMGADWGIQKSVNITDIFVDAEYSFDKLPVEIKFCNSTIILLKSGNFFVIIEIKFSFGIVIFSCGSITFLILLKKNIKNYIIKYILLLILIVLAII